MLDDALGYEIPFLPIVLEPLIFRSGSKVRMSGVAAVEVTIKHINFTREPITSPTALKEALMECHYIAECSGVELVVQCHKIKGHAPLVTRYYPLWLASRALVLDKLPKAKSYHSESVIRKRIILSDTDRAMIHRFRQSIAVIQDKANHDTLTDNMRAIREMRKVIENELKRMHPSLQQIRSVAEYLEVLAAFTTLTPLEVIEMEKTKQMIDSMIEEE